MGWICTNVRAPTSWRNTDVDASVWKDPKRPGYRGKYRNVELFFIPSAEVAMAILDREIGRVPPP